MIGTDLITRVGDLSSQSPPLEPTFPLAAWLESPLAEVAPLEPTFDLIRATGPSLVLPLPLDGPQLSSRWTSRYAAILNDDPGSAVLTSVLTAWSAAVRRQGTPLHPRWPCGWTAPRARTRSPWRQTPKQFS